MLLNKEIIGIEESLNVIFDESFPEPKLSPLVEDNWINELIVQDLNGSPSLQVNVSNEGYPKSVKEARGHSIKQVIDNPIGSLDNVLDNQIFKTLSNDSHASSVKIYLNDEEEDDDSMEHREENKAMFMSINEAVKLMLVVATTMSRVVENDIGKEGSKDNFKEKDT
nr:hypothetical protein [Tanacetum cinerariifolium]